MNRYSVGIVCLLVILSVHYTSAQVTGTLILSTDTVSINIGDSVNITATLQVGSEFVSHAFFRFENKTLDVEEATIDLNNGSYIIPIRSSDSFGIIPGNFTDDLIASVDGVEVARAILNLEVKGFESVNPTLHILSSNQTVSTNDYKLALWGSDESQWRDLSIYVGGNLYYYLKNTYPTIRESGSVTYNKTHVAFDDWIGIKSFSKEKNFTSSSITVVLRDLSFNEATKSIQFAGDYIDPVVTFLTEGYTRFRSREISLDWVVEDESNISSQVLFINGVPWIPISVKGERALGGDDRHLVFFYSVPKDESVAFNVRLVVTDIYGNSGEVSIDLFYDSSDYITQDDGGFFNFSGGSSNSNTILPVILLSAGILLLTVLGIFGVSKFVANRGGSGIAVDYSEKIMGMFSFVPDEEVKKTLNDVLNKHSKAYGNTKKLLKEIQPLKSDLLHVIASLDTDEKMREVLSFHTTQFLESLENEVNT